MAPTAAVARPISPPPSAHDVPLGLPNIAPRPAAELTVGPTALARALGRVVNERTISHGQLSVQVVRLDTNEVLFSHRPHDLLVPASNAKLVTTLAALDGLTPDFQFNTDVYGAMDANGVIAGDLSIKGYGDPYLVPERIWYLATRLKMRGVRDIKGALVVDDTYFDPHDRIANGWREDHTTRAYMAPAGAVSAAFNAIMVHVLPSPIPGEDARVVLDPEQGYFTGIDGRIATVDGVPGRAEVDVVGRRVRVSGSVERNLGPHAFWRRVDDPPQFAGEVLAQALRSAGISFSGPVVVAAMAQSEAPLLSFESPRLGDLVVPLTKFSNNFMAAQLALTLGAAQFGGPATWHKAHRAIDAFLRRKLGFLPGSYQMQNASGLHSVNRLSAQQLVRLLAFARRQPRYAVEFTNSLPAAAGYGTLAERMHGSQAAFRVRAKTGTLSIASSLSGYAQTADGVPLAFSFLCNRYRRVDDVWAAQDRFAETLACATLDKPEPAQSPTPKRGP